MTILPRDWFLLVVDLKDCFFTIQLQPQDTCRFAFTLRSTNREKPDRRFEWVVLPQGMKNSPTMCQLYVDWALQPIRHEHPDVIIYNYMDDIIFCSKEPLTSHFVDMLTKHFQNYGLQIAPEKIQATEPWKYLGWSVSAKTVKPLQPLPKPKVQTLADVQKLAGDLQWLRPMVGLTNADLAPIIALLRGTDPAIPIDWTPEMVHHLDAVLFKICHSHADPYNPDLSIILFCWPARDNAYALLCQSGFLKKNGEVQESILEWLFPPISPPRRIFQRSELVAMLIMKDSGPRWIPSRWRRARD